MDMAKVTEIMNCHSEEIKNQHVATVRGLLVDLIERLKDARKDGIIIRLHQQENDTWIITVTEHVSNQSKFVLPAE